MLSKQRTRDCLDRLGIASRLDSDGDLCFIMPADETFPHDVEVFLITTSSQLMILAHPVHCDIQGDILQKANEINSLCNFPAAIERDGDLLLTYAYSITEDISDKFLREDCIKPVLAGIWNACVRFLK